MRIKLLIVGSSSKSLVVEPWGEEFNIESRKVEIVFSSVGSHEGCGIEIDCSEEGFLRIESPLGFRPIVLLDGREDERPAFSLS
jgi:hypothetical protein